MSVMSTDASGTPTRSKYDRLIAAAQKVPAVPTLVVHPCDESSLRGAVDAAEAGIIKPILVGPAAKVRDTAAKHSLNIASYEIVDAPRSEATAAKAVEMIHAGKGEALMKGSLHTDELMRSVTAKVGGLRTDRRISHVFIMDVPAYADTVLVTDAAINIFPDLEGKRDYPKRRRSIQSGWLRHDAAGRDPVCGRNSNLQNTLDDRRCRAVQDG